MIPHGALFAPRRIATLALACSMLENLDRKRKSCDNFEKVFFLLSQFPLSSFESFFVPRILSCLHFARMISDVCMHARRVVVYGRLCGNGNEYITERVELACEKLAWEMI